MKRILSIVLLLSLCGPALSQGAKGYIPPKPEVKAKLHQLSFSRHGHRLERLAKFQALPASFDCREKGWVLPVGDQGSCGSCYLYSTIYGTLTSAFVRAGYGKADGSFVMAVQYGMDCHNFGGCNGGNGTEVITWIVQNGWYAESWVGLDGTIHKDYPAYSAGSKSCRKVAGAKLWKIADWGYATGDQSNRPATTDEIKTALFNFGPLNVSLDAGGQFGSGTGTITALGTSIDHEIELVAYDDNKDGGAFLLKNQWASSWGNGGYRWITYKAAQRLVDVFWISVVALPPAPPPGPPPTPVPVDFPLELSGDTYVVVNSLPFKVKAPEGYDDYSWSYPPNVTATDDGDNILEITAAPSGPIVIKLRVLKIDFKAGKTTKKKSQITVVIGGAKAEAPREEEVKADTEEPPVLVERTYLDAACEAAHAGKFLVGFFGTSVRPIPGAVIFDEQSYKTRIVVSWPKRGVDVTGTVLPANATDAQIMEAAFPTQTRTFPGGRVESLMRTPFRHKTVDDD